MPDQIILEGIRVMSRIGVPRKEREKPQPIEISIILELDLRKAARTDDLKYSVDYAAVHGRILEIARARPRRLIENLAGELARALLKEFRLRRVEVEVRKFVLPKTRSVAVRIVRAPPKPA